MQVSCFHSQIETIGRRSGMDYVRCKECGQILEADDLEPVPAADQGEADDGEGDDRE